MPTIHEDLALAVQHHQAGELHAAEQIYRHILAADPNQADALHLLGVIAAQTGQHEAAVQYISRAIALNGTDCAFHSNLGNAFKAQGKLDESIDSYRRALELKPDDAGAHYNLGSAFQDQGELEPAVACFRRALELHPDFAEAHNNLGNALRAQRKLDDAGASYRRALELNPDQAEASNNLGTVFQAQENLDEAVACYRRALELKPDYAAAYNNLGTIFQVQRKLEDSADAFHRAIALQPDYADAHYNLSLLLLQRGDFERGWPEYEWRLEKEFRADAFLQQLWKGSGAAACKTILLHTEQGLGDTLQFIRYAPFVRQLAGKVLLRCSKRLIPLLSCCRGIDVLIPLEAEPPACDAEAYVTSLPRAFQTTLETVPREVPYLFAEPDLIEQWRSRLPSGGFKVGIVWQGNPEFKHDKSRSIPLVEFGPLAALEGVRLISLQMQHGIDQLFRVKDHFSVTELARNRDESAGAFMDTAAILMNLDLVITPDTSIAHLAGGLGVPVWVALSFNPDWRWLLDRPDSPWYPTMRLFRQKFPGDWPGVFDEIRTELCSLVPGAR